MQSNRYVREQLAERGWAFETKLTARLRNAASLPWLKNTVMAFVRATQYSENEPDE